MLKHRTAIPRGLNPGAAIPSGVAVWALSAYAVVRLLALRVAGIAASPLRLYATDLLAPLVLIPLFTWMQVWFGLRSSQQALSGGEILAYVSGMGLLFEGILPLWTANSVADPLDVAAYACGGLLLWMLRPRSAATDAAAPPAVEPDR